MKNSRTPVGSVRKSKRILCVPLNLSFSGFIVVLLYSFLPVALFLVFADDGEFRELRERINEVSTVCSSSLQREKLPYDDDFILRQGFRSPKDLCGFSEKEIKEMLSRPYNCSRLNARIYLGKKWMNSTEMRESLHPPPNGGQKRIECMVFCIEKELPCLTDACLIPVHVRRNSTDPFVTRQLMDYGEYDMVHPGMDFRSILDAGANCGIATIIFATMFPEATIVSVEPSSLNFEMLQRNTKIFRNVIPVHAGLWATVATLALVHGGRTPGAYEWGYMVQEQYKVPKGVKILDHIQGLSVDFLAEVFGLNGFELLKVDIEGSEKEMLAKEYRKSMAWLNTAKMAMFEVHEDMRVGAHDAVASTFFQRKDWEWIRRFGEYHVYKKKGWNL